MTAVRKWPLKRTPPEDLVGTRHYRIRLERKDPETGEWVLVARYQQVDFEAIDRSARAFGGELRLTKQSKPDEAIAEWVDGKRVQPSGQEGTESK
jgi:hypothetical protein